MEIDLVRWPTEADQLEGLRAAGRPRLLMVEADVPAPVVDDPLEDWIRLPVSAGDLRSRVESLSRREESVMGARPVLEDGDIVRFRGRWVAVPPLEARLLARMIEELGVVVTRAALVEVGWPHGSPRRNSLDVHILRLRRRLAPLDLAIRTVRSRGYVLREGSQAPTR